MSQKQSEVTFSGGVYPGSSNIPSFTAMRCGDKIPTEFAPCRVMVMAMDSGNCCRTFYLKFTVRAGIPNSSGINKSTY